MKFWELLSAFRSSPDSLRGAFRLEPWREPFLDWYERSEELIANQDRAALDFPVPLELSREVAKNFSQQYFFDPSTRILRRASAEGASQRLRRMSALEVHDNFGGSVFEEVQEYGSARIPVGT